MWCDFAQLHNLIASISGTEEAIDKRKTALSTAITRTFDAENVVKIGAQVKKL